jgi:hypothetical protein
MFTVMALNDIMFCFTIRLVLEVDMEIKSVNKDLNETISNWILMVLL